MPANGKANGRFVLPALKPVNFSLTEGTNIPPPPESPVEEKVPAIVASTGNQGSSSVTASNGAQEGSHDTSTPTIVQNPPLSPGRPSSIRRFLSRKSLNANYIQDDGSHQDIAGTGRPQSPMSVFSRRPSLASGKSRSWLSRLTGKRSSIIYEDTSSKSGEKRGPPPPTLPELSQLKAKMPKNDVGSLGGADMFKHIHAE